MVLTKRGLCVWGWALLLGILPIQGASLAQDDATPEPVVLFEDDFATYSGRWMENRSPKSLVAYADGQLAFSLVVPGVSVWSVPDFETPLVDYRVEVTALITDGEADAQYGILLDYAEDDAAFYVLVVTLTGEWQFLHYQTKEWTDLTPADPAVVEWPEGALDFDVPVQLAVDVSADTVTLWINDQRLTTVSTPEPLSGTRFGLIARAEHGFINVAFDDVMVLRLFGEAQQ